MRSRRPRTVATVLALMALLYLQAVAAFAACEVGTGAGTGELAAQAPAMPDCHDAANDGADAVCHAHCQGESQALSKIEALFPDLAQPLPAPRAPLHEGTAQLVIAAPAFAFAAPPPRILFQSFLL